MNKKTLYGKEARAKMLDGVKSITDAIRVTLGPMGRNVIVAQSAVIDYGVHNLPLHCTKDGFTTAKCFDTQDPFEKVGVLMVKECTNKTVEQCGDGTSTSAILLHAILEKAIEMVDSGTNPMELKKGLDKAVEYVVEELKKISVPIKGNIEKIRQIASISANNDKEIGDLIASAFQKIGDEGDIDIEPSKSVSTEIKLSDGYKWNSGWVSPLFVNIKEKALCEFTDPLILLYDKRITHSSQIETALLIASQSGKPLLIICEDAQDEGLAFVAMNVIQQRIKCCIVKAPSFGDARREEMEDIALLTGGTYISDIRGVGIKEVEMANLGTAKKVIISKEETIIIGGNSDQNAVNNLLNELRMNLTQAKNEEEKSPIEKRIAKLTGAVAVIQVGAATETEMKEKMDRVDDAVRATKSAIQEGYLIGAGTVFAKMISPDNVNNEYKKGFELLFDVLKKPLLQICENAGVNGGATLLKVLAAENNIGYNAKADKIEDLEAAGIIDPAKVLRCSLQNSASSAAIIFTSECIICDTI